MSTYISAPEIGQSRYEQSGRWHSAYNGNDAIYDLNLWWNWIYNVKNYYFTNLRKIHFQFTVYEDVKCNILYAMRIPEY
jgi:hypothetical protein